LNQKSQLIAILLDSTAREDERDDAAIDLANFDGEDVVQALFAVATDPSSQSEMIKGSCGESLASIWVRTGEIDISLLGRLDGTAKTEALGLIKINRTDWHDAFVNQSSNE
jgi:hypothetical protein